MTQLIPTPWHHAFYIQTDTCSIGLEDSLIAMDLEGTGRISTKKIEEHLQNSSFYSSTLSQALNALCKKMNGSEIDDSLSCSRFMNWLGRPYNPIATASMKLRYYSSTISIACMHVKMN